MLCYLFINIFLGITKKKKKPTKLPQETDKTNNSIKGEGRREEVCFSNAFFARE